jgi:hypothetical protein
VGLYFYKYPIQSFFLPSSGAWVGGFFLANTAKFPFQEIARGGGERKSQKEVGALRGRKFIELISLSRKSKFRGQQTWEF